MQAKTNSKTSSNDRRIVRGVFPDAVPVGKITGWQRRKSYFPFAKSGETR